MAQPRLGLNFVRYHWDRPGEMQRSVAEVNADLQHLGADAMRQFVRADLVWRDVEPSDNNWNFQRADEVLNSTSSTPIVTLFSLQYASGTPHWAAGPGVFRSGLGVHAKDYVETVVKRYADRVQYWEVGNEMDHWRAADPGDRNRAPGKRPPHNPPGGFTPEQQGKFVAAVAAVIRAHDPDAIILMPGMAGLSPYVLDTWLPGFVRGAGVAAFDVVNYHFYGPWRAHLERRERLGTVLASLGLGQKPVWLSETGSSSEPERLNEQAADVFRRALTAWGAGDQAVFWHTHVSSANRPNNRWRGYGLRAPNGDKKPSYMTYQLLAEHVAPFSRIAPVQGLAKGQFGYEISLGEGVSRWVFWGQGRVPAPSTPHAKAFTSVLPNDKGKHSWRAVPDELSLSEVPILLRN